MSKPYHKWLLDAIENASFLGLHKLAPMAKEVTIPKGHHDEVIDAWKKKTTGLGLKDDLGVSEAILGQKAEAEAEQESMSRGARYKF